MSSENNSPPSQSTHASIDVESSRFVLTEPSREHKVAVRARPQKVVDGFWIEFHPVNIDWAKAKAKMFKRLVEGVRLSTAQGAIAYVYGYPDWHELESTVKLHAPPCHLDHFLSNEHLEARLAFQARRLQEFFELDMLISRQLVNRLRPSGRNVREPERSNIDEELAEDERIWRRLNGKVCGHV